MTRFEAGRRLLIGLGLVATLATPAVAVQMNPLPPGATRVSLPTGGFSTNSRMPGGPRYRVALHRSVFGTVGPRANVQAVCGQAGAIGVANKPSAKDVTLTILSLGFYSPTHAVITCNQ
jgi:hypothetical protein